MTATIDLVLLGPEFMCPGEEGVPRLEVKTIFYNFTDTHGIYHSPQSDKAMWYEKMFSDPKLSGLETYVRVKIVEGIFKKSTSRHLRLVKSELSSWIHNYAKKEQALKRRHRPIALSLNEFLEHVDRIGEDSSFWSVNDTIPAIAYLISIADKIGTKNLWVFPLTGEGLAKSSPHDITDYNSCIVNVNIM
ncbi:MAG: hypothetical protein H6779_04210 [Candidatus Nomurabacteria bacterium]|nr:MAG: hypothetical protein H6779_04210 [Candidatus Nomurabacteria bacterium]